MGRSGDLRDVVTNRGRVSPVTVTLAPGSLVARREHRCPVSHNASCKLLTRSLKLSCSIAQWRTPQQALTRITQSKRTCALHQPSSSKNIPNSSSWISWFLSSKGNEYFCEVEDDYILDRFNLTGLNTEVQNYTQALDLITDNLGTRDPSSCHPLPVNPTI